MTYLEYSGNKKYRLYLYETRIIQEIHFKIEALAEGGVTLDSPELIFNVTCPSFATVTVPNAADHGIDYENPKVRYLGGLGADARYDFPGFYPSFEQCNFITGYAITSPIV